MKSCDFKFVSRNVIQFPDYFRNQKPPWRTRRPCSRRVSHSLRLKFPFQPTPGKMVLSRGRLAFAPRPFRRSFNSTVPHTPSCLEPSLTRFSTAKWPQNLGVLCPPTATLSAQSLDALLLRFSPIFRQGQILTSNTSASPEEIRQFREYAMCVDDEFALWPASQPEEWRPKTMGFVARRDTEGLSRDTTSPTRVDTYFDRKSACQTSPSD